MKTNNASSGRLSTPGWQILGELELPAGAVESDRIYTWLAALLEPLHLHPDVLNRLLKSARAAAARFLQSPDEARSEHIHFRVFIPLGRSSGGQSWGFYRLGKIEGMISGEENYNHAIELYLYSEG